MAKRYTEDDLPIVEKRTCALCDMVARGSVDKLVANGWLTTSKGLICPACPYGDEGGGHTVDLPKS